MTNIAVLGSSFGDEGKGRVVHDFSPNYDWIIRFNGGANAGHTIYRDSVKYVHNLMPSFDWRSSRPKAFLGSGMVIDLEQLHKEVIGLYNVNSSLPSRVYVDPNAFVVLPEHKEEDKRLNGHIGSTNRGIGPAYKAKIGRQGLRIYDVMHAADQTLQKDIIQELRKMGVQFKSLLELRRNFEQSELLFEGAQGVMLDINHGIYPYVSCSESTIAGVYSCGFNFVKIDEVYGVAKCYTTKVGEGPFPTELTENDAHDLRERGNEYGATTGRPRRIGWIDLPALDYACKVGGITKLIITKFDILNGMDNIPICVAYRGKEITAPSHFYDAKPQYIQVPGWNNAKEKETLSTFIKMVERGAGVRVSHISFGTAPEDLIKWDL